MVPLAYSPRYNVTAFGLERLHPFDGAKFRRIHDWLITQGLRTAADFHTPSPCTWKDLRRIHTPEYLRSLMDRRVVARILEVPQLAWLPGWVSVWRILRPMRWATGGTILACRLALEHGLAINLGGGFHHASAGHGHGFCAFADVALALADLHREGKIASALVIDTDAHQGDGTADTIRSWPWAHIVDFYEEDIFPWPKVQEDSSVPLRPGMGGTAYLEVLRETVPQALDRFRPTFVVYNAGSDVLETDPLSRLRLSAAEMAERDLFVVTEVRGRGVPLAIVLSGGYGPLSWDAHAHAIEGMLTRFDGAC